MSCSRLQRLRRSRPRCANSGLPHLAAQRAFAAQPGRGEGAPGPARRLDRGARSWPPPSSTASQPCRALSDRRRCGRRPSVPGLEGRTTLAVAELINEASSSVYAATYSAALGRNTSRRWRMRSTAASPSPSIVDRGMQEQNGGVHPAALPVPGVWAYAPEPVESMDPRSSTPSSSSSTRRRRSSPVRTSPNAAAKLNLECGLLSRDAAVAEGLVRHLETAATSTARSSTTEGPGGCTPGRDCSRMRACAL